MTDEKKEKEQCAKCEEYLAGWKRALADYDNLKKDTERNRIAIYEIAVSNSAEGLLRLCDQMDNAIQQMHPNIDETNQILKGLRIFRLACEQEIKKLGLEPFCEPGEIFSTDVHDAVASRKDDTKPDQSVLEVVQRGWKIGSRVIRPAKVIVNQIESLN
jgi:molecular chaperone GrpE